MDATVAPGVPWGLCLAIAYSTPRATLGEALSGIVRAEGTAGLDHPRALLRRDAPLRDLADAIHALVGVHAAHPGTIDAARSRWITILPAAWADAATHGFDVERGYLVALCAAVGPLPSTPGQAESATAVASQRAAFGTLVASERPGCAIGAGLAIILDWQAIRPVLDAGARRVGFAAPPLTLPDVLATEDALGALGGHAGWERATLFGAQQALAQHRGLWDLLEARVSARAG